MSKFTMHQTYISKPPAHSPVEAFWVTAKLPEGFSGEVDVRLVVNDGKIDVVFLPEAPQLKAVG